MMHAPQVDVLEPCRPQAGAGAIAGYGHVALPDDDGASVASSTPRSEAGGKKKKKKKDKKKGRHSDSEEEEVRRAPCVRTRVCVRLRVGR